MVPRAVVTDRVLPLERVLALLAIGPLPAEALYSVLGQEQRDADCDETEQGGSAAMTGDRPAGEPTLAQKIDALFRSPGHEYTYAEVAEGIRQRGGPTISTTQLWELRNGVKTNPRIEHLEALAKFFQVPIRYFFADDELGQELYSRLQLLNAMRDSRIERIALRASGLSPQSLQAIAQIIEQARQIEGIPNGDDHAPAQGLGRAETDPLKRGEDDHGDQEQPPPRG